MVRDKLFQTVRMDAVYSAHTSLPDLATSHVRLMLRQVLVLYTSNCVCERSLKKDFGERADAGIAARVA